VIENHDSLTVSSRLPLFLRQGDVWQLEANLSQIGLEQTLPCENPQKPEEKILCQASSHLLTEKTSLFLRGFEGRFKEAVNPFPEGKKFWGLQIWNSSIEVDAKGVRAAEPETAEKNFKACDQTLNLRDFKLRESPIDLDQNQSKLEISPDSWKIAFYPWHIVNNKLQHELTLAKQEKQTITFSFSETPFKIHNIEVQNWPCYDDPKKNPHKFSRIVCLFQMFSYLGKADPTSCHPTVGAKFFKPLQLISFEEQKILGSQTVRSQEDYQERSQPCLSDQTIETTIQQIQSDLIFLKQSLKVKPKTAECAKQTYGNLSNDPSSLHETNLLSFYFLLKLVQNSSETSNH
jgi:hypothetical protein